MTAVTRLEEREDVKQVANRYWERSSLFAPILLTHKITAAQTAGPSKGTQQVVAKSDPTHQMISDFLRKHLQCFGRCRNATGLRLKWLRGGCTGLKANSPELLQVSVKAVLP